jgi:hypothetical protein
MGADRLPGAMEAALIAQYSGGTIRRLRNLPPTRARSGCSQLNPLVKLDAAVAG